MAQEAGASAIILFNEGQPGRTAVPNNLPLGAEGVHIPGVGTSFDVGVDLNDPGTVARVKTEVLEQLGESVNVIAETPGGDPSRTVVIGAHLDSVPAGPGINDNGSGSAGILEIAEVYAAQGRTPRNKLRFMWYGAEEIGLVGSTKYVEELTQDEKDDILAMLNFDMIGSPNFARYVYDGDGTDRPRGPDRVGIHRGRLRRLLRRARGCSTSPPRSTGGPTTGRSSPTGFRPAGCSPAPSSPRLRLRSHSTAASPAPSSTPATTLPATRSRAPATVLARPRRGSVWSRWTRCPTPRPTRSCSSRRPRST